MIDSSATGDHAVEGLHVLQRAAHDERIPHAEAVVAEDAHLGAGVRHRPQLGEPLALLADGHRADRLNRDEPGGLAESELLLHDAGGVGDGRRVGHGEHRGVAAGRRRPRAGEDRLGCLVAGLPEVRVQIDQAREEHQSVHVDDRRAGTAQPGADLDDRAVRHQDVGRVGAFDERPAEEQGLGCRVAVRDGSRRAHRGFSFSAPARGSWPLSAPASSR
jgi:hypothetical protein